jgi:hypothetical protein
MYVGLQVKYPLLLSYFNATWIFSTDFQKNTQISNSSGSRVVPCGRMETDTHDEAVTFRNFAIYLYFQCPELSYLYSRFSSWDHIAPNNRIISECWIWRDVEGSRYGIILGAVLRFPEGTEANHENLKQNDWSQGRTRDPRTWCFTKIEFLD